MKKYLLIVIAFFMLSACNNSNNAGVINEISSFEKLQELMVDENYLIVDVRTKEEYDSGHIVDAINIPYTDINENIDLDNDKTIFVYCYSGMRSKIAKETLEKLDYIVYDLGAYDEIDLPKSK